MHSPDTKVKLQSKDDFYNVLGNIKEASDQLVKDSTKNKSREYEQFVQQRMDSFFKELTEISSSHVQVPDGETINLEDFETEPYDARLAGKALELEKLTRVALENIIDQRKNTIAQLEPLAKEIISHKANVDRTVFGDSDENEKGDSDQQQQQQQQQEQNHPVDLKEYKDVMRMLHQLEKTIVETKMDVKQTYNFLESVKLLQ